MKILVLNAGSSSLKVKLFLFNKTGKTKILLNGHADGIGQKNCKLILKMEKNSSEKKIRIKNHQKAIDLILHLLLEQKIIRNKKEIKLVGHRVVHGGEIYTKATLIDKKTLQNLEKISQLAPLHNPHNIAGIKAAQKLLPDSQQVGVFDTSFHRDLPEKAYIYGTPYSWYQKYGIRRYGFHGISHDFVTQKAIRLLRKKNAKIITCHLGNGSSITASKSGKSLDTSMGFTPLEGPIMGTRCGSIDPGIILFAQEKIKINPRKLKEILWQKSGFSGISDELSDMRKIYQKYQKNEPEAILIMEILAYQIAKYCGGYTAALGGLDALVFTGGIGENAFYLREKICNYFIFLGLIINKTNNQKNLSEISTVKSKIKVFVIPTDEENQIARETKNFLKTHKLTS